MVTNRSKHSDKTPVGQGRRNNARQPNRISASTPYDLATFCYTSLSL